VPCGRRLMLKHHALVVVVVVTVVVVPILLIVPAMGIRVPPAVIMTPAVGASIVKLVARAIGLRTIGPVMVDRLMQMVSSSFGALLAFVGAQLRSAQEHNESGKSRSRQREPGVQRTW